jgi:LysM repeat protein
MGSICLDPIPKRLGETVRNSTISMLVGLTLLGLADPIRAAGTADEPQLQDNPPERHIVVKGDTLWDISRRFLKNPWRWPDLWGLNKDEVRNPHLIYPGNVIVLDRSGLRPRLRLENNGSGGLVEAGRNSAVGSTVKLSPRLRSQDLTAAPISSIPASVIEPFLNRPLVVTEPDFEQAPRIVAVSESRVLAGAGDAVYVGGTPRQGVATWQVYRSGKALVDPISNESLGFEVIYLGDAQLAEAGEVATMRIARARQEIGIGDRLVEAPASDILAFAPRSPDGSRNGVEPGQVFGLFRAGRQVKPRRMPSTVSNDTHRKTIRSVHSDYASEAAPVMTPAERYGDAFVFRTFEKVSYALVMSTTRPVNLLDLARAP